MKNSEKCIFQEPISKDDCILLKPIRDSRTADRIILFQSNNDTMDGPKPILGFQFKNMFDALSISMINEEILKFITAVEASRINFTNKTIYNNGDCKTLFVIVITGKGTKDVEDLRGKILEKHNTVNGLGVPDNIQLLVLSENDASDFVGFENFNALRHIQI